MVRARRLRFHKQRHCQRFVVCNSQLVASYQSKEQRKDPWLRQFCLGLPPDASPEIELSELLTHEGCQPATAICTNFRPARWVHPLECRKQGIGVFGGCDSPFELQRTLLLSLFFTPSSVDLLLLPLRDWASQHNRRFQRPERAHGSDKIFCSWLTHKPSSDIRTDKGRDCVTQVMHIPPYREQSLNDPAPNGVPAVWERLHGGDEIPLKISIIGIPDFFAPHDELRHLVHPFRLPLARKRPPEPIQVI